MSNTSFNATLKIRTSDISQLVDAEISSRFTLDFLQSINHNRKSQGNPLLFLDDNCSNACLEVMNRIAQYESVLLANDVIGTDFKIITQEDSFNIPTSRNQNEAIYDTFQQLVGKIDSSQQSLLYDPYYTHIGLAAKRNYGSFKFYAILFRKEICIHHTRFEVDSGCFISGKMLNPQLSLLLVVIKDSKDAGKETFGGPKRIKFNCETYEFEVMIPRLLLNQRSATDKFMEFFAIQADPREIPYGQGTDLNSIPPNAIPVHKMNFNVFWESNIMFELRKIEDSIFVGNEFDSKNSKSLLTFSTNEFSKPGIGRGRGRGRGTIATGRGTWINTNKQTPFKSVGGSRLSNIAELPSGQSDMTDTYQRSTYNRPANSWENQPVGGGSSYMNIHGSSSYSGNKENSYLNRGGNEPLLPSASRPESREVPQVFNFGSNPFATQKTTPNPFSAATSLPIPQLPSQYYGPHPSINTHNTTPYSSSLPMGSQIISTPPNPMTSYQMAPQIQNYNYQPIHTQPPLISPMHNQNYAQTNLYQYQIAPQQMPPQQIPPPQMQQPQMQHQLISPFIASPNQNFYQQNQFMNPQQRLLQPGCQFTNPQLVNMINSIPPGTPNIFTNPRQPTQVFSAVQSGFGQPSAQGIFGTTQRSSLGSTFNHKPLDKLNQQLRAVPSPPKEENKENPDLINIPCLILPIPKNLLEEVRKVKPENSSYKTLYSSMEYSDVLIRVKETDIKAHKAVLYSASQFFREYLDRLKGIPSSIHVAKIIMPNWFTVESFKIVLKFMYSCDIEKESINLVMAKEILQIADHLDLIELVRVIVVKFVITQLTKDEVLGFLQLCGSRAKDTKDEAWEYLTDSCAMFAAQHSNWLVRNRRAECLATPLNSLMRMIEFAMGCCVSKEHITLVLKLLTDIRYADDIFALASKISGLYMLGYTDSTLDIRMVDFVKPFSKDQLSKLDESMAMEYAILEESAPYYLTNVRQTPVPPPHLPESINLINAPSSNVLTVQPQSSYQNLPNPQQSYQSMQQSSYQSSQQPSYQGLSNSQYQNMSQISKEPVKLQNYSQNFSPVATCIFDPKNLKARNNPVFSFSVPEINRSRNVMSKCFTYAYRKWSVLVSTCADGYTSLFLCERGNGDADSKFQPLLFTSVLFELEIDDSALKEGNRIGNQSIGSACFYAFPNDHFHIVGERKYCKTSTLKNQESAIVNVYMRPAGIHSGILHYLSENFSTLIAKDYKSFRDMSFYNMKYILSHDSLAVKDEHEAAGALWKYAASREPEVINILIPEIRYQYLSMKDLLTLARDHKTIRSAANFGYLFKQEYYRRTAGKPITEKPRNSYMNTLDDHMKVDHNESIIDWILHSNHHEGYDEKLSQVKKQYEEEKAMNDKRRAELNAKKHELYIENDKLAQELRKTRGEEKKSGFGVSDMPKGDFAELRSSRPVYETYDAARPECQIM